MTVEYINTDLDLISKHDLRPLAAVFADAGMCVLHALQEDESRWRACIEAGLQQKRPDCSIAELLRVMEKLEGDRLRDWRRCTTREFNIGYRSGMAPYSVGHHLNPALMRRIVDAGASIGVTVYAIGE